jgi:hypothetical protein
MQPKRLFGILALSLMLALLVGSGGQPHAEGATARSVARAELSGGPVSNWFRISPPDTPEAHEWYSSVAYNSQWQEYLVVWHASTATNRYIYGQFVSRNGALIGSRFMISPPVGNNMYPDVAYDSNRNEYLVVYMVETATPNVYGIYGIRLNAYGEWQGSERCFAAPPTPPAGYTYWHPAVAYSTESKEYLVTWQEEWGTAYKGIEARTLPGDGGTLGSILEITGLQVDVAPSQPDVAYTPALNEFLVVWQRWYDSNYTDHDVMGQRIHMEGGAHLQGSTFPIYNTTNDEGSPAVASVTRLSGVGEYLVACVYVYGSSAYIAGQLLTDAGALHDWAIISPYGGTIPAVASNENTREFLVAWKYGSNIQARTVTTSGGLGPYAQAMPYGSYPDWPAVAGGPLGDYLVTCQDEPPGYLFDVFGYLWGTRVFLPLVVRNY